MDVAQSQSNPVTKDKVRTVLPKQQNPRTSVAGDELNRYRPSGGWVVTVVPVFNGQAVINCENQTTTIQNKPHERVDIPK